jgi:MarR family
VTPPRPKSTRAPLADETTVRSWLSVVRAYNLCDALMTRRFAALGVRTAEHEILANLRRDPGLSQQTLAARCFTAKSSLSGVITDLEQRGWVRREPDPADARAKRLSLTAEGPGRGGGDDGDRDDHGPAGAGARGDGRGQRAPAAGPGRRRLSCASCTAQECPMSD